MTAAKSKTQLSIGGFTGYNELPIHTISWTVPGATASVVIFHGLGDHSGRYDRLARRLNDDGLNVFAYDFQGHGRSGGRWCYIQDFNDLAYDAKRVIADVESEHPQQPVFLLGHSLGALVIANALASPKTSSGISGAILMSPTIEVEGAPSEPTFSALLAAGPVLKNVPTSPIDPQKVTADPEAVAAYESDAFAFHRPVGLRTSLQLIRGGRLVMKIAPDISTPALVMYGALDELSLPKGTRAFYEELGSEDKMLEEFPESKHELFNDPATPEVIASIVAWISARGGTAG